MKKYTLGVVAIILLATPSTSATNDSYYDVVEVGFQNYETFLSNICLERPVFNISGVSALCQQQLTFLCDKENRNILRTMIDASSKFPWPGLNYASLTNYGIYDECIEIEHEKKYDGENLKILGKYCTGGFVIPTSSEIYQLSICTPDKCGAADFNAIVNISKILNITTNASLFYDSRCSTKETGKDFSAGDIAIIVVFAIFLTLLVICTVYDIYLYKTQQKSKHPLLVAFSVLSNGKKLLQTSKGKNREQILCFHGLKYISMWWIMAGHGFSGWTAIPVQNYGAALNFLNGMGSTYISPVRLAVDTFFFISGFLLAYQYLKQRSQPLKAHLTTVPKLYLHRYLRLTPVVLMVYLYVIGISPHIGSGPIYNSGSQFLRQPCIDYWWSFFLYIQNYYNPEQLCITHTWYLSADMQLFILSPLVAIPVALYIKKNFKLTMQCLLVLNILFLILPLITIIGKNLYFNEYGTHGKLIDYWIGFMLGAYMREKKDKSFKISEMFNVCLWILVLGVMLAVVVLYKHFELTYGSVENQVFYMIMRPAWCIGLSWIVFACHNNYGGIVNWLLTRSFMQIGSKLTYCLYLTHGQVLYYYLLSGKTVKYFSPYVVFYEWCGCFIVATIVATVTTLTFESPIIIIEKMIFGGHRPPPSKHKADTNQQLEGITKKEPELA